MKIKKEKLKFKILFQKVVLALIILTFFFCFSAKDIKAVNPTAIQTADLEAEAAAWELFATTEEQNIWEKMWENAKKAWEKAWSQALNVAVRNALNKIAYDTATWIGSGGKGQQPLFIKEGWGTYLTNIADQAAGDFIEKFAEGGKFNLCQPDLNVRVRIGLGLVQQQRPKAPACTFKKMLANWDNELKNKDFLKNFQDMFSPTSNDLGIALSLFSMQQEVIGKKSKEAELYRQETKGWLDITNIAGNKESLPNEAERRAQQVRDLQAGNLVKYTGDALVDAANVFLNQLAITLFNNLMNSIGKKGQPSTSPYSGDYGGLLNAEAGPGNGGVEAAKNQFRSIIEPKFNVRGDYNILAELTMCNDPNKAGPTNCVITDKFRQAIADKKTVGQAMQEGLLNGEGIFGFTNAESLEPKYQDENYPYRSMKILRKFRIIPVGWEVAASYFKNNSGLFTATLKLKDLVGCFSPDDEFPGMETFIWCQKLRGLVDPNWVLKAPLNYCRREGPGPEILSQEVTGEGADSKLAITRNDKYCADEQTCVRENADGSCKVYGYCTEEKRKWNFGSDSCEPNYNTCQTFKSSEGQSVSYLKNTLNFSDCNIDKVGCQKYKSTPDPLLYNTTTREIAWKDATENYYFDKDVKACDEENEGCHEFIRTASGLGANLLPDSSFEEDAGALPSGTINTADSYDGQKSLNLTSTLSRLSNVIPGFDIDGEFFTFSFYAKNCGSGGFGLKDNSNVIIASSSYSSVDSWARYEVTHLYFTGDPTHNQISFYITPGAAGCLIDALKFERGDSATPYSDYGTTGKTFLKLAPDYLNCNANNPPAECANYTKRCAPEDIGCNVYTSLTDETKIPAKALTQDYCPDECLGYDSFVQQETYFENRIDKYLIPKKAKTCSAESVGCEQFTNLDALGKGAEATEYYISLKQCIKPDNTCSEFYTWEGSDEAGYQLKAFQLKQEAGGDPAITEDDSAVCNETIYNLPATDPAYNPDCRQYYSRSGSLSYHLYTHTITCADNCHPYRLSDASVGPACKNGGQWEPQYGACLYNAIPGEGIKCSAKNAGCREYTGNKGANMNIILNNDFEGNLQGWNGIEGSSAVLNNTASLVGKQSLFISGGSNKASTTVSHLVRKGKSYVLSFVIMPSVANQTINAYFTNGADISNFSTKTGLNASWQYVKINLENLDHDVSLAESLVIAGGSSFYIDSLRLTEITDRYYLIKNSWQTPLSCDQDQSGNPAPHFMAGCEAYTDKDGKINNLHSFTKLCAENSSGCELMIDTHNTKDYGETTSGPYTIPTDSFAYIVYSQDKECKESDKGCARFGLEKSYDGNYFYNDAYLVNDPDKNAEITCAAENVGCAEWEADNGKYYFKDPGDEVCEYKQKATSTNIGWYKKKMKRCDLNSNAGVVASDPICYGSGDCALVAGKENTVCSGNADCGTNNTCVNGACRYSCLSDGNDYECPTEILRTAGTGGKIIYQPGDWQSATSKWAGYCPASDSGCTELIDPLSGFSVNNIFNPDFSQQTGNAGTYDGWSANTQKIINLEPYALYRLAGKDTVGTNRITFSCTAGGAGESIYLVPFDPETNTLNKDDARAIREGLSGLGAPQGADTFTLTNIGAELKSRYFYFAPFYNYNCQVSVQNMREGAEFELKKVVIDYQLEKNINKQECNGLVNKGKGCVLFNERMVDGLDNNKNLNAAKLYWDADKLEINPTSTSPIAGSDAQENDANAVIKVEPDRDCNKWLACKSQVELEDSQGTKKTECFDIGLCKNFNEDGTCGYFDYQAKAVETATFPITTNKYSNYSGYIIPKGEWERAVPETYYQHFINPGAMEQVGEYGEIPNGDFEDYDEDLIPSSWHNFFKDEITEKNKYTVINNPISAQKDGIVYPMQGKSFLKLSAQVTLDSDAIDVQPNTIYSISGYLNTMNLRAGKSHRAAVVMIVVPYDASGDTEINGIKKMYENSGSNWDRVPWDASAPADYLARFGLPVQHMGLPWQKTVSTFITGPYTYKIRVQVVPADLDGDPNDLHCAEGKKETNFCEGSIYADNIQIKPLLHSSYATNNPNDPTKNSELFFEPTCRLYSKSDSLACDYYEDSGKRIKGWPGYCLDYDSAPGSQESCLLWWPGERIKGDGIYEEGASYQDRAPLYYCINGLPIENLGHCISGKKCNLWGSDKPEAEAILEFEHPVPAILGLNEIVIKESNGVGGHEDNEFFDVYGRPDESSEWELMAFDIVNYGINHISPIRNGDCGGGNITGWITTADLPYYALSYYQPGGGGMAEFHFDINKMSYTSIKQIKIVTNKCITNSADINLNKDISSAVSVNCQKIAKVVTPTGQNKYWSARVYKGTDYKAVCTVAGKNYICDYNSDYPPFGSAVVPNPENTPEEWDASPNVGRQPLTLLTPDKSRQEPYQPRAGQIYTRDSLKRLFAQSYGIWEWNGNWTCKNNNKPPSGGATCRQDCPGGTCVSTSTVKICQSLSPTQNCVTNVGDPGCAECDDQDPADNLYKCHTFDSLTGLHTYGSLCCPHGGDCQNPGECAGGSLDGGDCDPNFGNDCPGSSCITLEKDSGYRPIGNDWYPPDILCAPTVDAYGNAYVRPHYSASTNLCTSADNSVTGDCANCLGGNIASDSTCDYCAVPPRLTGLSVNTFNITKSGFVNFKFGSIVDGQQLPLIMYKVDWGDGTITSVTGVEMRDRRTIPHSLYHSYDYWTIRARAKNPNACTDASCTVQPKVIIQDNWGWCSNSIQRLICTDWQGGPSITVSSE